MIYNDLCAWAMIVHRGNLAGQLLLIGNFFQTLSDKLLVFVYICKILFEKHIHVNRNIIDRLEIQRSLKLLDFQRCSKCRARSIICVCSQFSKMFYKCGTLSTNVLTHAVSRYGAVVSNHLALPMTRCAYSITNVSPMPAYGCSVAVIC